MSRRRVTVGLFDFTGCEGCQIELTNLGAPALVGLLDHIELVEFREAITGKAEGPIDIALIEGSLTREADRQRLEDIRRRSGIVIAFGACAATGGVNALREGMADPGACVYGQDAGAKHLASGPVQPLRNIIHVDHELHGCPASKDELVRVLGDLLHGKAPLIPNYPVCVDCKLRETVCRYHRGDHCLGPVARAGCGAPCPADGIPCEACRGFVDHPNLKAMEKILQEKGGLSPERATSKTRIFAALEHRKE